LLAFSTISQVGFILLGFAVGGKYGIVGGMLFILAHALAKSGLFYGVGLIEDSTGKNDLNAVSGMFKESPVLGVSMAFLAGSIVGFFPMIGFFSKLNDAIIRVPFALPSGDSVFVSDGQALIVESNINASEGYISGLSINTTIRLYKHLTWVTSLNLQHGRAEMKGKKASRLLLSLY